MYTLILGFLVLVFKVKILIDGLYHSKCKAFQGIYHCRLGKTINEKNKGFETSH